MRGGLIVVRAGEGMWAEAYDNLDFFGSFWVKPKRTKKKQEERKGKCANVTNYRGTENGERENVKQ